MLLTDDWGRPVWPRNLAIALLVALAVWGMQACYHAGVAEMEAEPPRLVAEKEYAIEATSYSCGKNCVSTSHDDKFVLFATDGGKCEVDRADYVRAERGKPWKCAQLFGWRD